MGLLSEGTPLEWHDVKKHADHVRTHGITQLINIFERLKDRTNDVLKWGDEVLFIYIQCIHINVRHVNALLCHIVIYYYYLTYF